MNLALYATVLILAFLPLFASDTNTSEPLLPLIDYNNDGMLDSAVNSAADFNSSLTVGPPQFMESNASDYDFNATNRFYFPNFLTGPNWFYYRGFLTGMDTVYLYGTDVVVVIGSRIDYSLYRFFTRDKNSTKIQDTNLSSAEEDNKSAPQQEIQALDTNQSIEQYVSSQTGKTVLPRQLDAKDQGKGERTYLISQWLAAKNVNDDYLDKNNHSFIRLRGGYAYDYRGENGYIYSIDAQVKIPRTREKLDFIIGDDTKNSQDLSYQGTQAERDNSIALGVTDLFGIFEPVESKIRLGFSGVTNPYAKASFSYEALLGNWMFLPSQTFRYSYQDKYEEWTNLEFRRGIGSYMMLSLLFQRSTITGTAGANYFMQPALNVPLGKYGDITYYCGIYGRTEEQPPGDDGYKPKRGIYRYALGINWSKQSSRKYIVYRLQPILSYDDQYQFQPNYYLKALLEFYFGVRD